MQVAEKDLKGGECEKGELVATNELKLGKVEPADLIQGTPAISDHALFIRSDAFLWKIAETK